MPLKQPESYILVGMDTQITSQERTGMALAERRLLLGSTFVA